MAKGKMKTGNPFLDGDFGAFMDFAKFGEQFKLPGVDSNVLMEVQKRNVEAMTAANRVALEGAQAVAQRQVEILRQVTEEATKVVSELSKPGKIEDKWAAQVALTKEAYELAQANMRELTEIGVKSNGEAADLLSHRFTDALDEIKGVFENATAK
jgi:phasin family protein